MTRKEKIDLLNGILKGLMPIPAIFIGWPEKTYYALPDDDENYETESGELVSMEEVDHQVMHYPKVRVISKEPKEQDVKINISHAYLDCEGNRIPEAENRSTGLEIADKDTLEMPAACPVISREYRTVPDKPPDLTRPADPEPLPQEWPGHENKDKIMPRPLYCLR